MNELSALNELSSPSNVASALGTEKTCRDDPRHRNIYPYRSDDSMRFEVLNLNLLSDFLASSWLNKACTTKDIESELSRGIVNGMKSEVSPLYDTAQCKPWFLLFESTVQ